ncbi:glycosyltransferase family 2 protein [Exercitatus varius]|uniref:glycosyltransferase family 2 protein n=1 Tax=Exercitatus varius TaxID=67857 RepID=UPI00294AE3C2|nr:glycosyltransferase family 2 protein [Exercitatus varius]MDG2943169.1 glycosyltransferase family 2 protein [Exercitatus varius]
MGKILTISIAAYNVENYIKETLDSLVASKYINELEIFVVDDGGKDNTLSIAQQYAEKFPDSIFPIHKENGGYGSTVNYSMKHATGKYFKLLDGDDWFNTQGLDSLIDILKLSTTDVIVNQIMTGSSNVDKKLITFPDNIINTDLEIMKVGVKQPIGMWAITYKTQILRDSGLILPEKVFYTDQVFCTIPFSVAKTIKFLDFDVYFYRIGRDGQSVSKESRIRNIDQTLFLCEKLVTFAKDFKDNHYIQMRVSYYYLAAIRSILLLPITAKTLMLLKNYERKIYSISPSIYNQVEVLGKFGILIKFLRKSKYLLFWCLKLVPRGMPNW